MTDATKFTVNTPYGSLVGVFTSEKGLRVHTAFDNYEYVDGRRVETIGGRLTLRGIKYTVDAFLHPIGACARRDSGNGSGGTWCPDTHTTGWSFGAIVNPAYDHGRRSNPGEIESSSAWPTIRRADGRDATWANKGLLSAAIVQAANDLTRTATNGPEQARIRNLQAAYVKADANARRLSAETDAAMTDLLRIGAELTALGALPDLAAAA